MLRVCGSGGSCRLTAVHQLCLLLALSQTVRALRPHHQCRQVLVRLLLWPKTAQAL
jgi:hypothetical protein